MGLEKEQGGDMTEDLLVDLVGIGVGREECDMEVRLRGFVSYVEMIGGFERGEDRKGDAIPQFESSTTQETYKNIQVNSDHLHLPSPSS